MEMPKRDHIGLVARRAWTCVAVVVNVLVALIAIQFCVDSWLCVMYINLCGVQIPMSVGAMFNRIHGRLFIILSPVVELKIFAYYINYFKYILYTIIISYAS